jgi:hypothetical protein
VGKLRDSLMSQKLSVAVITPYKAQVRRLKQALAVVICPDREGERDRDRGDRGDDQNGKNGAVDGGDKRDRGSGSGSGSGRGSGRDRGRGGGKSDPAGGRKGRGNEPTEEGEEEEEEEAEVPFDCEVNSIDGFQVCTL